MCTVSWIHDTDGGYQVLCNRDEKLTRLAASTPAVVTREGVRFIAPCDRDHAGTWMSVNELGVSICLLNRPGPTPVDARSRGLLVLSAAISRCAYDAVDRVSNLGLNRFAPFTLLALDQSGRSCVFHWDGLNHDVIADAIGLMPLTSSSVDTEEVCNRRRNCFERQRVTRGPITSELLFDFHCSHRGGPSAYSTCMHREDAATVSFSWVKVSASEASYFYSPAAPCRWASGEIVRLDVAKGHE